MSISALLHDLRGLGHVCEEDLDLVSHLLVQGVELLVDVQQVSIPNLGRYCRWEINDQRQQVRLPALFEMAVVEPDHLGRLGEDLVGAHEYLLDEASVPLEQLAEHLFILEDPGLHFLHRYLPRVCFLRLKILALEHGTASVFVPYHGQRQVQKLVGSRLEV